MKRLIILSNYLKHCRLWALVISEVWLNLPTWGATLSRGPDSCKRVERWNSRSSSGLHGLHRQRNLHWELGSLPVWIPGPLRALCIQRWSSPWECQTEPGGAARQMSQNTSFTQTQQKISQYYACAFHLTWRLLNQTVSCDRLSLLSACSNTTAWFIITTKVVHRDTWDTVCDKKCKKKKRNNCDSWQIIFSLVHASPGENSCSQTASGSCCTADPTPEPCHSGSHLPEGQGGPCCGRVWTFCGTDPGVGLPWLRKRERGNERTHFLGIQTALLCIC